MFYDKFKELCRGKAVSVSRAATDIGLSNSTPTKWKNTGAMPDSTTITKIAAYFGVGVGYLLGTEDEKAPTLTKKDERDIEKRLESVLEDLEGGQAGIAFSGEPMDDETRELLIQSLRNSMEVGKALAKKKFTPKKYQKE